MDDVSGPLQRFAQRLVRVLIVVSCSLAALVVLMLLEASGGHDGWLCEWGIDTDGAGTGDTGCG